MAPHKNAWKDEPASGPQLHTLRQLRPDIPEDRLQRLTKGEASFLMDEYRRRPKAARP